MVEFKRDTCPKFGNPAFAPFIKIYKAECRFAVNLEIYVEILAIRPLAVLPVTSFIFYTLKI